MVSISVNDPKLPQPGPFPPPAPGTRVPQVPGSVGNTYDPRPIIPTVSPDKATTGNK